MTRIIDRTGFITANTLIEAPPLVPEIRLHLAHEILPIWELTEEELEANGLPPPFWAFAWAGGQALARYTLDTPAIVRNKRVLDFGAGSGLGAIAAMRAGAAHALAVDIDAFAAEAMALNAALNGVAIDVSTENVLVRTDLDVDVILVGDMCYEGPLAEAIRAWIEDYRARGVAVYLGDPKRTYFKPDGLECLATYSVPTLRALEDNELKRTSVWKQR